MSYRDFLRNHRRFLTFGFVLTLFSSFGQTFFVSLFGADLRAEFDLSHRAFGSFYSAATLVSAISLAAFGRWIDRIDLRWFASGVCVALISSCFLISNVSSLATLAVALFAIRFSGQGLMTHTSFTSMARYFDDQRGKAIAIAMLGFPAGEALFPRVAVEIKNLYGWRTTWFGIGVALAIILIPLITYLLRGHTERHRRFESELARSEDDPEKSSEVSFRRRDVLRDSRFYFVLPALMAPGFILTGLFFHQAHLAETKQWTLEWLASCFVAYALTHLTGALAIGPLIDRFRAQRLLPYFLAPLALGLGILAAGDSRWIALPYLLLAGLAGGAGGTIGTALWAEIYGVKNLGGIRSLTTSIGVFSTALSPVSMGWLIDRGVSFEWIASVCAVFCVVASIATLRAFPALLPARGSARPRPDA